MLSASWMGNSLSQDSQAILEAATAGDAHLLKQQIECEPKLLDSVTLLKRRGVLHLAAKQGHPQIISTVLDPLLEAVRQEYHVSVGPHRRVAATAGGADAATTACTDCQVVRLLVHLLPCLLATIDMFHNFSMHHYTTPEQARPIPVLSCLQAHIEAEKRRQQEEQEAQQAQQQQQEALQPQQDSQPLEQPDRNAPLPQQQPPQQSQQQQQAGVSSRVQPGAPSQGSNSQPEVQLASFKRLRHTVNARDLYRRTPLIVAAKQGHLECAHLLVDAASNLFAVDREGNT